MSKTPLSATWALTASAGPTMARVAPASMVRWPERKLWPARLSVPEAMVTPPSGPPSISPENEPDASVSVSVRLPVLRKPVPDSVVIEAPLLVWEMSSWPLSTTPDDAAIAPEPFRKSAPLLMVVRPV